MDSLLALLKVLNSRAQVSGYQAAGLWLSQWLIAAQKGLSESISVLIPYAHGAKNLEKAIASSQNQYDFEIRWHPFFLDPSAPKEGVNKREFYRNKFGPGSEQMAGRRAEIFKGLGMEYDLSGLTGNTLDSHRLLYLAGNQGFDKQHNLAEELFRGYFTQGRYIGDREFLLESARKVGVEGAAEFLEDASNGLKEVNEELEQYSSQISGVPHYVIDGKYQLSGGQPPENFLKAFQMAAAGDT